jgi:DNA polymerase III epsilon subunit-like protein
MQHWNGHQMCAIDIETGGLDPNWHEILQICILPLDANCDVRRDVMPFYIDLRPEHPTRVEPEARKKNGISLERMMRGFDQDKAKDLLEDWVNKLQLPYTKYGKRKRILPLGQGYHFDKAFLQTWLGVDRYSEIFDGRVVDTVSVASYLNDLAAMHAEKVPFSKVNLSWLCKQLSVPLDRAHDAMADCVATAAVYKKLIQRTLLA